MAGEDHPRTERASEYRQGPLVLRSKSRWAAGVALLAQLRPDDVEAQALAAVLYASGDVELLGAPP